MPNDYFSPQLYQVLATAIEIMNADKGNIQFYDEEEKALKIVAHIGFNDEFLRTFASVSPGHAACGQALEKAARVIVEDIFKDPSFINIGPIIKTFGYTSVQSTPLFDGNGNLFGMLSTHFTKKHYPNAEEFHVLDTYLKAAVPILARKLDQYKNKKMILK